MAANPCLPGHQFDSQAPKTPKAPKGQNTRSEALVGAVLPHLLRNIGKFLESQPVPKLHTFAPQIGNLSAVERLEQKH
jgi:hypothetical protein